MAAKRWRLALAALGAALLVWAWPLVKLAAVQLLWGLLLAMALLPVMRRLEKRFCASLSAGLSLLTLGLCAAAWLLFLLPPLASQARQLAAMAPALAASVSEMLARVQKWLESSGVPVAGGLRDALMSRGEMWIGTAAGAVMGWIGDAAGQVGRWMLSPVFAYYFLRDRQLIGGWLLSLLPVDWRGLTVRILREMRRETAGYVRGQLLVSAIVGGLTAAGLLLCRVPAWLLLGALMGVMELIPYAGPFIGGVMVALFSLPGGMARTLWALGVVLVVQQAESSLLAPRLVSDATRLHPLAVVLCVMLGGAAGGIGGVLAAVPLLLCLRAALRVVSLTNPFETEYKKRFSKP